MVDSNIRIFEYANVLRIVKTANHRDLLIIDLQECEYMAETDIKTDLSLDGYSQFSILSNPYRCRFIIASNSGEIATEFKLENHTVWGLIDELAQAISGPRQRVFIRDVSILELSELSSGWLLAITFEDSKVSYTFKSKKDLQILSDALKRTSSWDPEKSELVSSDVIEYLNNPPDTIAKDMSEYIKKELQSEEKLALFDIDAIDIQIKGFWQSKGIDWAKIYHLSYKMEKDMDEIERMVLDSISDATIRAQDGIVDSLSRDIVSFCRENKLEKASKKTIEDILRAKGMSLPERIKQRLYARANSRLYATGDLFSSRLETHHHSRFTLALRQSHDMASSTTTLTCLPFSGLMSL